MCHARARAIGLQAGAGARAGTCTRARARVNNEMEEFIANATACSFKIVRNKYDHYHSLNGEDQMLLPTLINAARGKRGTFVELGAFTGSNSNTAVLERCFGWSGLLIEASPANFAQLRLVDRPRSHKVHSAICNSTGRDLTVPFTVAGGPVAGQVGMFSPLHQQTWAHVNKPSKTVRVPCQALQGLLAENHLKAGATFLSLDVEGAEELVLSTVQPSVFKVIIVETDGSDRGKEERIKQRIIGDGFRFQQTLSDHISNSSAVFIRHDVKPYPLPQTWFKGARLGGRVRWSDRVNVSSMTHMLAHAARSTDLETKYLSLPPAPAHVI